MAPDEQKIAKFNGENFGLWRFKLQMLAESAGLWQYMTENVPEPGQNAPAGEVAKHLANKSKARAMIGLNCEDSQLMLIRNAGNAKEALEILTSVYQKKSLSSKLFLRRKFFTVSMNAGDSMLQHINKVKDLASQLAAIEAPVSEDDQVTTLLASLPPDYENLITSLESRADDLTLQFVVGRLLHEESKKLEAIPGSSGGSGEKVLGASGGKARFKGQRSGKPKRDMKDVECYKCHQKGHFKRNCRSDPKPLTDEKETESRSGKSDKANPAVEDDGWSDDEVLVGSVEKKSHDWVIDSGATSHICRGRECIEQYVAFEKPKVIRLGDKSTIQALGKGFVRMKMEGSEGTTRVQVLYAPDMRENLFSVSAATDNGATVEFDKNEARVKKRGKVVAKGVRKGRLYQPLCTVLFWSCTVAVGDAQVAGLARWHARLGHLGYRQLEAAVRHGTMAGLSTTLRDSAPSVCAGCLEGKMLRRVPKGPGTRANGVLDLVHSDVCGPMQVQSFGGARYFVIFVDDFTRYVCVYLVRSKSDVLAKLQQYHKEVTVKHGVPLKILRSDNGGEYTSKDFTDYLVANGVVHQTTMPDTPQQNGVSERMNRTVQEAARAMMRTAGVSAGYWGEATSAAVYVRNRCPTKALGGKTPFQMWNGVEPDVGNLRVFGCIAHVKVPDKERKKWDAKSAVHRFVGYCEQSKGYRFLDPWTRKLVRSRDAVFDEDRFDLPGSAGEEEASVSSTKIVEPRTVSEALSGPHAREWKAAMDDEYNSLLENKTWELVRLPKGRSTVTCKWCFRVKYSADGSIDRFKARLVARGYSQRFGIDYEETFSPVARHTSIRCVLAFALMHGMNIHQMDVKTAFLNGALDEEIYMQQPEGYEQPGEDNLVCRLLKSLYGLKQAARCWNKKLDGHLKKKGFQQCAVEPCVYVMRSDAELALIAAYVDDLVIVTTTDELMDSVKGILREGFKMTDNGPIHYCLGIEILRSADGQSMVLSQRKYIGDMLENFGMADCKSVPTPVAPGVISESRLLSEEELKQYQSLVGMLIYASTGTRPDITTAVRFLGESMSKATQAHWQTAKRVLQYLKGTIQLGLLYHKNAKDTSLHGYADSDWANSLSDRRSITGWMFKYGGGPISWCSKKQACVTLSSTEAEYVAASQATQEAVWLRRLLTEMRELTESSPGTVIYEDNQGCIALAKNPAEHKRTKHIDTRYHFVREKVEDGQVVLAYIPTNEMVADFLTKFLPGPKFKELRSKMGMAEVSWVQTEEECQNIKADM